MWNFESNNGVVFNYQNDLSDNVYIIDSNNNEVKIKGTDLIEFLNNIADGHKTIEFTQPTWVNKIDDPKEMT